MSWPGVDSSTASACSSSRATASSPSPTPSGTCSWRWLRPCTTTPSGNTSTSPPAPTPSSSCDRLSGGGPRARRLHSTAHWSCSDSRKSLRRQTTVNCLPLFEEQVFVTNWSYFQSCFVQVSAREVFTRSPGTFHVLIAVFSTTWSHIPHWGHSSISAGDSNTGVLTFSCYQLQGWVSSQRFGYTTWHKFRFINVFLYFFPLKKETKDLTNKCTRTVWNWKHSHLINESWVWPHSRSIEVWFPALVRSQSRL